MDIDKSIQFLKRFIQVKEQELDWFYKQDDDYYKDSIEESELVIQAFKTILNELEKKDKVIDLMAENMAFDREINCIEDMLLYKKQIKQEYYKKVEG